MASKDSQVNHRSDADLQAIQTSVAFKNISDAVEQYRRQFGLAFLALIAFSAIHVGLVVIANLYTMQTRVSAGLLTDASDTTQAVATSASTQTYDLAYIMSNMDESAQIKSLSNMKSVSFVDKSDAYRQYTVTGFQLGGWKRSELKLYTSVGHVLEYVRGKGVRVFSEAGATANQTESRRSLLGKPNAPTQPSISSLAPSVSPTYMGWSAYKGELDSMLSTIPPQSSTSIKSLEIDTLKSRSDSVYDLDKTSTASGIRDHVLGSFSLSDSYISTELPQLTKFASGLSNAAKTELTASKSWGGSVSNWESAVKKELTKAGYTKTETDAYWETAKHNSEVGAKTMAAGVSKWLLSGDTDQGFATPTEDAKTMYYKAQGDAKNAEQDATDTSTYAGMLYWSTLNSAARSEAVADAPSHESKGYAEANKVLSQQGDWDGAVGNAIHKVMTTIAQSVDYTLAAYSQFKSDKYIGGTETGSYTDAPSNAYGCTADSLTDLTGYNSDPADDAITNCGENGNMVGGYFFSEVLGTYEAFMVYFPDSYCTDIDGKTKSQIHAMSDENYFLYFLHGWGQSAELLLEASPVISYMATESMTADFVTIAPEDGASPFGGKTWYANVVNNGYHMDMIAYELPDFLHDTLGVVSGGSGLFGFSMGGFGTASMLMTYAGLFNAGAAFNAPLDAHVCFVRNACHLQCGVNPVYCELMWTSIQSAMNPYVTVKSGAVINTQGYYDPVATGVAVTLLGGNGGSCSTVTDWEGTVIATTSGKVEDEAFYEYDDYTTVIASHTSKMSASSTMTISQITSWPSNYYLDPIYFIVSSAGYAVTHNPLTDAENYDKPPDVKPYGAFLMQMPITRVRMNPTMWTSYTINTYFLVACDPNDEYGLGIVSDNFADIITSGLDGEGAYMQGGFLYDAHGTLGHTMSERDFGKAYQFFSDVFYTMKDGSDYYHEYKCSHYLNPSEMTITAQVGYLYVGSTTPSTDYAGKSLVPSTKRRSLLKSDLEASCTGHVTTDLSSVMSESAWKDKMFDPTAMPEAMKAEYASSVGMSYNSGSSKFEMLGSEGFKDSYAELCDLTGTCSA
jgi:hypothetical protein